MSAAFHHDMPSLNKGGNMKPVLQLALDFVDLKRALKNAQAGIAGGVDWLEAKTPRPALPAGLTGLRQARRSSRVKASMPYGSCEDFFLTKPLWRI